MNRPEAIGSIGERERVREGYRRAREVTRAHAKSFYFASYLLFGQRRRAAFALYAFCRRLDDLVDGEARSERSISARLQRARQMVAELYVTAPELASPGLPSPAERLMTAEAQSPWHPAEFAAFKHCVRAFRIPEEPFQDLISGMEMDLTKRRYASFEELDLYCYRVAGVVGRMLTPVLGYSDERAFGPAADLGRAMQLTNILRDVREDLERDRIYLPQDELSAFGLSEADLRAHRVDDRLVAFMRCQISRARWYYARAACGVQYLTGFGARRTVALMGAVYGDILRSIELQGYDVFARRAFVPTSRKLALAAGTLAVPGKALPALEDGTPVPALPTEVA